MDASRHVDHGVNTRFNSLTIETQKVPTFEALIQKIGRRKEIEEYNMLIDDLKRKFNAKKWLQVIDRIEELMQEHLKMMEIPEIVDVNRYNNIFPYRHTYPIEGELYYNANKVWDEFIAAQGPLTEDEANHSHVQPYDHHNAQYTGTRTIIDEDDTIITETFVKKTSHRGSPVDLMKMMHLAGSNCLVTLGSSYEADKVKFEHYFVNTEIENYKMDLDEYGKILWDGNQKIIKIEDLELHHRTLLKVDKNGVKSIIHHYICPFWLDHTAPPPGVLKELIYHLQQDHKRMSVTVHCSAGVGRTGTLIVGKKIHDIIDQEEELSDLKINLVELVLHARYHRVKLVMKHTQLQALFDMIMQKINERLP